MDDVRATQVHFVMTMFHDVILSGGVWASGRGVDRERTTNGDTNRGELMRPVNEQFLMGLGKHNLKNQQQVDVVAYALDGSSLGFSR